MACGAGQEESGPRIRAPPHHDDADWQASGDQSQSQSQSREAGCLRGLGCALLHELAQLHPDLKQRVGAGGGIDAILRTMDEHRAFPGVLQRRAVPA